MALIDCPECGNQISEKAIYCPMCGYTTKAPGAFYCFEYISKRRLFGLPLVHIVLGPALDPATGKIRVAKGIIAIGGIAMGNFAMGGLALGVIALGGGALGLAAFGGVGVGLVFAMGGLAIGFIAIGGCAVGYYAIGGGAFGIHALGGNAQDEQLLELFERWGFRR
jgi:hypothetical protein